MLGGDFAASDASVIIQSVCCEASIPENTAPNSYKELCHRCNKAVIEAEAIEAMTKVNLSPFFIFLVCLPDLLRKVSKLV